MEAASFFVCKKDIADSPTRPKAGCAQTFKEETEKPRYLQKQLFATI